MNGRPRRQDVYADDFQDLCVQLAKATVAFSPDLLVGIETGGARVAEGMLSHLGCPVYVAVAAQRPATKVKRTLRLGAVVSRLPRPVADCLRWMEVEARERMLIRRPVDVTPAAEEMVASSGLRAAAVGAQRILVVDDTVDSGRTLSTVTAAVRLVQPGAEVKTAVLASTWRRPPVRPDFCLLERTLLRMPWSFDASPSS